MPEQRGRNRGMTVKSADWNDTGSHPWRRYAARVADTLLLGIPMWFLLAVVGYLVAPLSTESFLLWMSRPEGRLAEVFLSTVLVIPLSAALIGKTGLSPGKWAFGVRVSKDGLPIGFRAALKREVGVWIYGWGLGLPIVVLVTTIRSYVKLQVDGETRWDAEGGHVVSHRPQTAATIVWMWLAAVMIVALSIGLKLLPA